MKKKWRKLFTTWSILQVGLFTTALIMRGSLLPSEGSRDAANYFFPFFPDVEVYDFTEMGVYVGIPALAFYFFQTRR